MMRRTMFSMSIATILAMTACSSPDTWPAQNANGLEIPQIHWPKGAPDMTDDRVATLINAQITLAAANYNHDFSSPELRNYTTEGYIETIANLSRGRTASSESTSSDYAYSYVAGPAPISVISVKDLEDTVAIVACPGGWAYPWMTSEADADPATEQFAARTASSQEYTLVRAFDGGWRLDGSRFVDVNCDLGRVRYGVFEPQPEYGSVVPRTDFINPDGNSAE